MAALKGLLEALLAATQRAPASVGRGPVTPGRGLPEDLGRYTHSSPQLLDAVDPAQAYSRRDPNSGFLTSRQEQNMVGKPAAWLGVDTGRIGGYPHDEGIGPYIHTTEAPPRSLYPLDRDPESLFTKDRPPGLGPRPVSDVVTNIRKGRTEGDYGGLTNANLPGVAITFDPVSTVRPRRLGAEGLPEDYRYRLGPLSEGEPLVMQQPGADLTRAAEGLPSSLKIRGTGQVAARPIGAIENAADAYTRRLLGREARIKAFPRLDEDRARRIAQAFDVMRHSPNDPSVRRAYDAMIEETLGQYRALEDLGIDITFKGDQYKVPTEGYRDLIDNGRLVVYPTDAGFGTLSQIEDNPLLKRVGRIGDLEDATANDAFRAVHDVFGHYGPGNPFFRAPGEERAWLAHSRMFSPDALPAMTSETRGQNSWVNFGPYAEANRKASGADTTYADQKIGLMPEWTWREGAIGGGTLAALGGGSAAAGERGGVPSDLPEWMFKTTPGAAAAALREFGNDERVLDPSAVRAAYRRGNPRPEQSLTRPHNANLREQMRADIYAATGQDPGLTDQLVDALDLLPGTGQAMAFSDMKEAGHQRDPLGMLLGAMGAMPW